MTCKQHGTTIISICWTSFAYLRDESDYLHLSVNFVEPGTAAHHTLNIESRWCPVKQKTRKRMLRIVRIFCLRCLRRRPEFVDILIGIVNILPQ